MDDAAAFRNEAAAGRMCTHAAAAPNKNGDGIGKVDSPTTSDTNARTFSIHKGRDGGTVLGLRGPHYTTTTGAPTPLPNPETRGCVYSLIVALLLRDDETELLRQISLLEAIFKTH